MTMYRTPPGTYARTIERALMSAHEEIEHALGLMTTRSAEIHPPITGARDIASTGRDNIEGAILALAPGETFARYTA